MTLDILKSALENASRLIQPGQPHYPSLLKGGFPMPYFESFLTEPIAIAMDQLPQLTALFNRNLNTTTSSSRVSSWQLATASIHHLLAKRPVDAIIADFLDLAKTSVCNSLTYVGIFGAGVTKKIAISEDVAIMPAVEAPPSLAREIVFGIDRWGQAIVKMGELPTPKPNLCALLSNNVEIFDGSIESNIRTSQNAGEKITALLRALTLSSGCPFSCGWQISWLDHPAIPYEGMGGYGAGGTFEETPKPRVETCSPVDAHLASEVYRSALSLPSNIKTPTELAIDRLRRSRVHTPSADTALDLGIAGEIVLLHGPPVKKHISRRYSERGAYLIATDPADRKEKYKAFRAMYDARSSAAHTGRINAAQQSRLEEFDQLCRLAILKVIDLGGYPNWRSLNL
ncbi:hypothetical protein HL666_01730 [Bradyrhizobium sp. 83002]|uniref:HEPN domain-containing protein n=1 Tax=Bradyrhizobium aeschynomenes TaxID=2734909 RepID=UPI001552D70A|nr:HEPN domain-containing protein [Bradyrhizobium aeschynomenes]NPU09480.1 hypothetical protein [Bradyrhizobium aeschynomenes]